MRSHGRASMLNRAFDREVFNQHIRSSLCEMLIFLEAKTFDRQDLYPAIEDTDRCLTSNRK